MSEPITRADLRRLANMLSGVMVPIDGTMLAGLIDGVIAHAKSASHSCAPTEAEYTTAREQDRAEGYRAGIEAAAQAAATYAYNLSLREWSVPNLLTTIRALADRPAPDPLLPGLMEARKMMTKYAAREPIMDAWDALRDKLDLEIEARKGG